MKKFARALTATPILETPDFNGVFGGQDGNSLPLDDQFLLRQVSAIAFPGTKFELLRPYNDFVFQALADEHRLEKLFVDIRFLEEVEENYPERSKTLSTQKKILEKLDHLMGSSYIWGGNWHSGIPEMKLYYPPKIEFEQLDPVIQKTWLMQGVDCSGLLYQASDGITPRATSLMTNYGASVCIQGKVTQEIIESLCPLDLIITPNHVVIVADEGSVIESLGGKGVIKTTLKECFEDFLKNRTGIDDWKDAKSVSRPFIIRRWHPELSSCPSTPL